MYERLHLEENTNIESVLHIIDKLNRDSVAKYRYMGQSLCSLAYEYYTKRFDRNIVSYCSPQVYNVLKDNINSPFLEFYKNNGEVAYDRDQQYTSFSEVVTILDGHYSVQQMRLKKGLTQYQI